MAAHVLRLRLALLLAPLRGSWRHVIRTAAGLVIVAAVAALAVGAIELLRSAPGDVAFVATTAI